MAVLAEFMTASGLISAGLLSIADTIGAVIMDLINNYRLGRDISYNLVRPSLHLMNYCLTRRSDPQVGSDWLEIYYDTSFKEGLRFYRGKISRLEEDIDLVTFCRIVQELLSQKEAISQNMGSRSNEVNIKESIMEAIERQYPDRFSSLDRQLIWKLLQEENYWDLSTVYDVVYIVQSSMLSLQTHLRDWILDSENAMLDCSENLDRSRISNSCESLDSILKWTFNIKRLKPHTDDVLERGLRSDPITQEVISSALRIVLQRNAEAAQHLADYLNFRLNRISDGVDSYDEMEDGNLFGLESLISPLQDKEAFESLYLEHSMSKSDLTNQILAPLKDMLAKLPTSQSRTCTTSIDTLTARERPERTSTLVKEET